MAMGKSLSQSHSGNQGPVPSSNLEAKVDAIEDLCTHEKNYSSKLMGSGTQEKL